MSSDQTHQHEQHDQHAPSDPRTIPAAGEQNDARRTMTLHEEQLQARKDTVEAGEVELRTEVVTERQALDVPVTHEEVYVEQRQVEPRPSQHGIGEGPGAEELRVPVREERVVADKQTYVTGEVTIGKRAVQETQRVESEVRREEARIEQEGEADLRGRDVHPPASRGR
jgi:uncharacterized protein (TIGR02271 family)